MKLLKMLFFMTIIGFTIGVQATSIDDFIKKSKCDQVIDKEYFDICYDYGLKSAKAVWYKLDGDKVNSVNIKKRPAFYSEKTIPVKYRAKSSDYSYTGYDRGHLANDASFDYDKKVVRKTYTMANIIAQSPLVNRKTWIKSEKYERKVAHSLGSANVINLVAYPKNPQRIGKDRVAVPNGFAKIIYNDESNFKKCFYYKNNDNFNVKKDKLKQHQISCNELDDYLSYNLDDTKITSSETFNDTTDVKEKLESAKNKVLNIWNGFTK